MELSDTVVVFSGSARASPGLAAALPAGARVVAADRGAEAALALGVRVELVVGDFDSIDHGALATLERAGARLERHPAAKEATDLELALDAALAWKPRRIVVVGRAAGRLDHLTAELLLLGSERYAGVELDALLGRARVHVVRGSRSLVGSPGELVSLLPLHGEARGVTTEGLVYALDGETLAPGSTWGVSNILAGERATITVAGGVLLAVRPGRRATRAELTSARRSARGGNASS